MESKLTLLAASNVIRVAVSRSPDTISDMATEQSDLNPIDYAVWGILQECVYKRHRITDVEAC